MNCNLRLPNRCRECSWLFNQVFAVAVPTEISLEKSGTLMICLEICHGSHQFTFSLEALLIHVSEGPPWKVLRHLSVTNSVLDFDPEKSYMVTDPEKFYMVTTHIWRQLPKSQASLGLLEVYVFPGYILPKKKVSFLNSLSWGDSSKLIMLFF